jgi:hypothetical protein
MTETRTAERTVELPALTGDWPAIRWFLEQVGHPPGGEPEMLA